MGCSARAKSCEELEDVEPDPEAHFRESCSVDGLAEVPKKFLLSYERAITECLITERALMLVSNRHICGRTQQRENRDGERISIK